MPKEIWVAIMKKSCIQSKSNPFLGAMYRLKFTPCPPLNKGYLIWESFLSSKKCSKSLSWVLSAGENAQDSDLEPFLEDEAKVKNFLRLSHLYRFPSRKKLIHLWLMPIIIFLLQMWSKWSIFRANWSRVNDRRPSCFSTFPSTALVSIDFSL